MSYRQPTSLVKFTDADSGLCILSDGALRWSAPCLFKDPFELDHHTTLNFDSRLLLTACVKNTLGLIFSRDDPKGMSPLIKAIRRWRLEDRFDSEEEAEEVLTQLLMSMVQQREPELLGLIRGWQRYSRCVRILCLSQGHDNVSLWDKNAAEHTGLAIRFACGDDTSLEAPKAMKYTDNKPEITALSEQLDILMHQANFQIEEGFAEKFLCKSKLFAKEKEWRLLKTFDEVDTEEEEAQWFRDLQFKHSEVLAIYFGAEMEQKKKQEINRIIQRKYKKAKLYQANPLHEKFELDFERLNPT